jgi:hypothetical protein
MRQLLCQLLFLTVSIDISLTLRIGRNPFASKYQLGTNNEELLYFPYKSLKNFTTDSKQGVKDRFIEMAKVRLGEPTTTTTTTSRPLPKIADDPIRHHIMAQKIAENLQNIGQLKGWLERRGPQVIRFGKRSYYDELEYDI